MSEWGAGAGMGEEAARQMARQARRAETRPFVPAGERQTGWLRALLRRLRGRSPAA